MDHTTTMQIATVRRALKEIADSTSHDLTLRQALVLLSVGARGGVPTNQQQLADEADLLKPTLSKIIANLAGSAGAVKREDGLGMLTVDLDPNDMRNRVVSLSKEGERILTRAMKRAFGRGE
jgi:DNA-binding MarR family transcriptional regulator